MSRNKYEYMDGEGEVNNNNGDDDMDLEDRMNDRLRELDAMNGGDDEEDGAASDTDVDDENAYDDEQESADAAAAELELVQQMDVSTTDEAFDNNADSEGGKDEQNNAGMSPQKGSSSSVDLMASPDASGAAETRRLSLRKRAPVSTSLDKDFEYDVNKAVNGVSSSSSSGVRSSGAPSGVAAKDNSLFEHMYNDAPPGM